MLRRANFVISHQERHPARLISFVPDDTESVRVPVALQAFVVSKVRIALNVAETQRESLVLAQPVAETHRIVPKHIIDGEIA